MKTHQKILGIIKLAYIPPHIGLPLAIVIYLLAISHSTPHTTHLTTLTWTTLVALTSTAALMILNNTNDIKEDKIKGRKNILTTGHVKPKTTYTLSIALYLLTIGIIAIHTTTYNTHAWIALTIFLVTTWLYSDKKTTEIFGTRLKEHYITEATTYLITFPTYTLGIWLLTAPLTTEAIITATTFGLLGTFYMLIKDMKDISSDRKAGLNTIATKINAETLLKTSTYTLLGYYLTIITATTTGHYNTPILIILIPTTIFLVYVLLYFQQKNWRLTKQDTLNIKILLLSTHSSLLFLAVGAIASMTI